MKIIKFKNRGCTLLFAVLISSVLLSLALAIFNQIYKSLLLSSASKESLAAFYSADFGVECALYWDLKHTGFDHGIFSTSSASILYDGGEGITCNGIDFPINWQVTRLSSSATTKFNLSFDSGIFPSDGCNEITVSKVLSGEDILTTVESRGYNVCDTNSPRRVERALKITY